MSDIVLYHSSWCPFCSAFLNHFRDLVPGGKEVLLDDTSDPRWTELRLSYVPTVLEYEGGKEVRRLMARPMVGLRRKDLEDWLKAI